MQVSLSTFLFPDILICLTSSSPRCRWHLPIWSALLIPRNFQIPAVSCIISLFSCLALWPALSLHHLCFSICANFWKHTFYYHLFCCWILYDQSYSEHNYVFSILYCSLYFVTFICSFSLFLLPLHRFKQVKWRCCEGRWDSERDPGDCGAKGFTDRSAGRGSAKVRPATETWAFSTNPVFPSSCATFSDSILYKRIFFYFLVNACHCDVDCLLHCSWLVLCCVFTRWHALVLHVTWLVFAHLV